MDNRYVGVSPAGAPKPVADEPAAARPKLPRRTPQAHLVTGLRTDSPADAAGEDTVDIADPATAVEQSFVRFARFRTNLHAGAALPDAPDSPADRGTA